MKGAVSDKTKLDQRSGAPIGEGRRAKTTICWKKRHTARIGDGRDLEKACPWAWRVEKNGSARDVERGGRDLELVAAAG